MKPEPITHLEKSIAGTVAPVTHLEKVIEQYGGGGGTVTVDASLSASSENPVQNKVINAALAAKGTYSKPSGGIPKSDLASAVQTSLLPVVSTSDNDKFLRVVSGAWAAATVPSAETASF